MLTQENQLNWLNWYILSPFFKPRIFTIRGFFITWHRMWHGRAAEQNKGKPSLAYGVDDFCDSLCATGRSTKRTRIFMDAELNPLTQDYTGQRLNNLANAVYIRIMTPLGSWWADPSLGSRLHELAREKDVPRIKRLVVQYCEQALQPLLDDGRALAVNVEAYQPHNGRCEFKVEVTDATRHTQTFSYYIQVS